MSEEQPTAPAEPKPASQPAPSPEPVTTPKPEEKVPDPSTLKSSELKDLIEKQSEKDKNSKDTGEAAKPAAKPEVQEEWFDKEKGFKTKEDAMRSYGELQNTLRQRAEYQKQLEIERDSLKQKALERPLTEEEKSRENSIKEWEEQNKEAIDFLERRLTARIEKKKEAQDFEDRAVAERIEWKKEFDKDESRRVLWPEMEKIFSEKGQLKGFLMDVAKNPFVALEALSFKNNFSSIAEKIRAEAVEQYKKSMKEAEEAEVRGKTEVPGGVKTPAGELDVSKMKSSEIASLLRREDE